MSAWVQRLTTWLFGQSGEASASVASDGQIVPFGQERFNYGPYKALFVFDNRLVLQDQSLVKLLKGRNLNNRTLRAANFAKSEFASQIGSESVLKIEGADLSLSDVREAKFASARFEGARFDGARLTGVALVLPNEASTSETGELVCPIVRQNLSKVHLRHADANGLNLDCVDLSSAKLDYADFTGASFNYSILRGSVLSGATLGGASFDGADLTATNFEKAKLSFANMQNAIMINSSFARANMNGVTWAGATVMDATVTNAILSGADMRKVRISNTNLAGSDLTGAALYGAKIENSTLCNTTLSNAPMDFAVIATSTLDGTKVDGAGLYGAYIIGSSLEKAAGAPVYDRSDLGEDSLVGRNTSESSPFVLVKRDGLPPPGQLCPAGPGAGGRSASPAIGKTQPFFDVIKGSPKNWESWVTRFESLNRGDTCLAIRYFGVSFRFNTIAGAGLPEENSLRLLR